MQVRRKELTNERRTRAWQNCMVQDKRLELLRRRQRDLNPPCLPIPPILHIFYIQPANTAIIVTLKTVSTMLSYTIRLWRFLLARSTFLWSRSISSFLLSRSNLYLHHASPDMKSPRSMFIPLPNIFIECHLPTTLTCGDLQTAYRILRWTHHVPLHPLSLL